MIHLAEKKNDIKHVKHLVEGVPSLCGDPCWLWGARRYTAPAPRPCSILRLEPSSQRQSESLHTLSRIGHHSIRLRKSWRQKWFCFHVQPAPASSNPLCTDKMLSQCLAEERNSTGSLLETTILRTILRCRKL